MLAVQWAERILRRVDNTFPKSQKQNMPSKANKLNNFVHAFGAARMLIQKANVEGALLEGLALYAALTDGFLRIGLVLKRQIVKNTSEVDDLLIWQEKGGQYYTERQIQRMAHAEGIITQEILDELSALYDRRNDAIHKFFLTGLQYVDLPPFLERYEIMYKALNRIVYDLEAEQIREGVGMSAPTKTTKEDTLAILKDVAMKIDPKLAETIAMPSKPDSTRRG
jgi:hypothetical protein